MWHGALRRVCQTQFDQTVHHGAKGSSRRILALGSGRCAGRFNHLELFWNPTLYLAEPVTAEARFACVQSVGSHAN